MRIRTVAARKGINLLKCGVNDSDNRQFILVLIGIFIVLYHMAHFAPAWLTLPIQNNLTPNIVVTYQTHNNKSNLYFKTNQNNLDEEVQFETRDFPAQIAPLFFQPIPINIASTDLLTTIPGIGPHLAHEIHDYIAQNGAFLKFSELRNVKGIGLQKSKQIAKYTSI